MPDIHILTSAKGGVGKTTLSLALFEAFGGNTAGLDLNTTNFDFFRIRGRGKAENITYSYPFSSAEAADDVYSRVSAGANSFIMMRLNGFKLIGSSIGFWRHIVAVASRCQQKQALIIDTNLHPANLIDVGQDPELAELAKEIAHLASYQVGTIYVWFIWTTATISPHEGPPDIPSLREFDTNLRKASNGKMSVMFMHVLNPQAYLPSVDMRLLLSLLGGQTKQTITPLERLANAPIAREIAFDLFLNAAQQGFPKLAPNVDLATLYNPMSKTFLQAGGRPYNVIPVPYLYEALVGMIEGSKQSPPQQVAEAQRDLSQLIRRYLGS